MRFVSTLLVFAGYCFVYASVAAGGRFATEPWAGLFADAYTPDSLSAVSQENITSGTATLQRSVRNRNPVQSGVQNVVGSTQVGVGSIGKIISNGP